MEDQALKQFISSNYVVLDTTVTMLDGPTKNTFQQNLLDALEETQRHVWIPEEVYMELKNGTKSSAKREKAQSGIIFLNELGQNGMLDVYKQLTSERFADAVFLTIFEMFRAKEQIGIITQDIDLATSVFNSNLRQSTSGKVVNVRYINKQGLLSCYRTQMITGPNGSKAVRVFKGQ